MRRLYMSLLAGLTLGSCGTLIGGGRFDEKMQVATRIYFKYQDGANVSNSRVYILESFGESPPIVSEVKKTDDFGMIYIRGLYCVPIIVATDGGGISIGKNRLSGEQIVAVNTNRLPTLEQGFGKIRPNLPELKKTDFYKNCGE